MQEPSAHDCGGVSLTAAAAADPSDVMLMEQALAEADAALAEGGFASSAVPSVCNAFLRCLQVKFRLAVL
jgi:hypothetical protein